MKKLKFYQILMVFILFLMNVALLDAQMLRLPDGGVNPKSMGGRRIGVTDVEINWNAPGVKKREGRIWGTDIAPYGFTVLGFGSNMESPWRAGANESTTISFSTDVQINGKDLAAGTYGFFIAVYPDPCTLIFNKNTKGWGAYFYNKDLDVLRVTTVQQKNQATSRELLSYDFTNLDDHTLEVALVWEYWRIPFKVEIDLQKTALASIQSQMSGAIGFDPASLEAAATWCLKNNTNIDQALVWINSATDPNLGGTKTFAALSTKAGLLGKIGKQAEADKIMQESLEVASALELHGYGRRLLGEKKVDEAMRIFEKNFTKHNGVWPTKVGMMRGYSAKGDLKNALKYAKLALPDAPDDVNKKSIDAAIKTLESGKSL